MPDPHYTCLLMLSNELIVKLSILFAFHFNFEFPISKIQSSYDRNRRFDYYDRKKTCSISILIVVLQRTLYECRFKLCNIPERKQITSRLTQKYVDILYSFDYYMSQFVMILCCRFGMEPNKNPFYHSTKQHVIRFHCQIVYRNYGNGFPLWMQFCRLNPRFHNINWLAVVLIEYCVVAYTKCRFLFPIHANVDLVAQKKQKTKINFQYL